MFNKVPLISIGIFLGDVRQEVTRLSLYKTDKTRITQHLRFFR